MNFKDWLQFRFNRDNHPKYKHYFDEWFNNCTEGQLLGFYNQYKRCIKNNYNI